MWVFFSLSLSLSLSLSFVDTNPLSQAKNEEIGEAEVVLLESELAAQKEKDEWVILCRPQKNPKKMSKKLGTHMAEQVSLSYCWDLVLLHTNT